MSIRKKILAIATRIAMAFVVCLLVTGPWSQSTAQALPKGLWEHSAYQMADRSIVEIKPIAESVPLLQATKTGDTGVAANSIALNVSPILTVAEVLKALQPDLDKVAPSFALGRAIEALQLASKLKLPQASKTINEALQLDTRNSYLHFFNGLIYHLMARQGDAEKTDTAIEGYQQAIRFDPNNWFAHEFLGLAFMEQQQFFRAQRAFAEVLLARPDDPDAIQRMMAASYMAGDSAVACAMADRVIAQKSNSAVRFLKASVLVYAACAAFGKAEAQLAAYKTSGVNPEGLTQVERRLENWRAFHKRSERADLTGQAAEDGARRASMIKVQMPGSPGQSGSPGQPSAGGWIPSAVPSGSPGQPSAGGERMVLVDVVMIRTEDTMTATRGINLLNALTLQFGSATAAAISRVSTDTTNAGIVANQTVLSKTMTIPALTYSLNIANANSNLNEVLARPTLAALEGMKSEFFSGSSLNAAVVSGGNAGTGGSVSIEKRYGVKLTILPQILSGGMIKLMVDASRTFLKPPSSDIGFTFKLEISEITASANVVMRLGDTLILSGLSEKETTNSRDGVPGLQDVPLLQYLFARQSTSDYQKSVLILITPRPASYTWLSEETRAALAKTPDDPFTPSLDVLRARYSDWFKPYPNLASVFHHLNAADLYREFRTGDVTLEVWDRMNSTRSRLKQALDFLYY